MNIEFEKMEGLGNDFVIIDNRDLKIPEERYPEIAEKLCNRRFGVGADGIILVLNPEKEDIKFRIFNSDGSEPEMCGNGMRCFARFVYDREIVKKKKIVVETLAGNVIPELIYDGDRFVSVKVDMGKPELLNKKIPFLSENESSISESLKVGDSEYKITTVSMGNPHAVIFVDSHDIDIERIGSSIENHERFPEKTNVEFVIAESSDYLKMRVWERGVGETLACGTGACAVLVASALNEKSNKSAKIKLKGGELDISWAEDGHIYKNGPATYAFSGKTVI